MAVVALAAVNGEGPAPVLPSPKTLNFSGYEWTTSTGPIFRAGARNFFDPANVWTDEEVHCIFAFREAREIGLRRR